MNRAIATILQGLLIEADSSSLFAEGGRLGMQSGECPAGIGPRRSALDGFARASLFARADLF